MYQTNFIYIICVLVFEYSNYSSWTKILVDFTRIQMLCFSSWYLFIVDLLPKKESEFSSLSPNTIRFPEYKF